MTRPFQFFTILICAISIPAYPEPTKIKIKMGSKVLTAEVAKTTEEIKTGLMDRTILSQDEGMVFLFKKNSIPGFWMKNTPIPLSIAFVDENNRIVKIDDMSPQSLEIHHPEGPIRCAIEVNQGWFKENNINTGDIIHHISPLH